MIPVRVVFLPLTSLPLLTSLSLEGGRRVLGRRIVGGGGLQASRDTCFLLSGPKWNLDKNTPLVAACLWVPVRHITAGNTEIQHVHIINVDRELLRVHVEVFHIPHFAFLTVTAQIVV